MAEEPSEPAGEVRFKPSPRIWRYLGWLSRHSLFGESESEVAKNILLQRLAEMRQEDYREPERT